MRLNRRQMLGGIGLGCAAATLPALGRVQNESIAGPFTADWRSLIDGYKAPDWFRDAKFGIWAHWGPQCVPEEGDWYARNMYLQGSRAHRAHLAKYGHPSEVGFMELINSWKAERWQPERLMDLYVRAGAKYFVAMANHHDNFDAYESSHHAWNSTRIGPKKDIIGTWSRSARERGLRFGVSNHSAHAWHWYQPAYGYDPEGAQRGVRYDAWRLTKADGRGKWWEGLDPQELYTGRSMAMPDGIETIAEADALHERTDRVWTEALTPQNERFAHGWLLRCRELLDKYRPELLYFDNFQLPFEQLGLDITAHFYNASMQWNGGRLEAVLNAKLMPAHQRMALVEDVERGGKSHIEIYPWQTCTCIGEWHYDRALYERDGYKTAATVVHTLCDTVSKNGNLLLSIPMRADGTYDEKEERILSEIADWMQSYGAAIYGTRPWRIFGEGPVRPKGSMFGEGGPQSAYTARDIRYVRKGDDVHALVLGWPEDGIVRLESWREGNALGRGDLRRVRLANDATALKFRRTREALEIQLPAQARNDIGVALVLSGTGITQGELVA